jgi:pimeloyl-ACP methyl ester carboxylesterase
LHAEEHGEGEPLLLHAGLGQGSWVWRWVLPTLAGRFRTIVFDTRGTGRSPSDGDAYGIGDLAADAGLRAVMGSASELTLATLAQAHVVVSSPGYAGAADTHIYLEDGDVVENELVIEGGSLSVPDRPGLGAEVDEERLARYPVPELVHAYSLYDE